MPIHELDVQLAIPTDPDLNAFASGVDEVDHYFRSRRWFDDRRGSASPPTYRFSDDGKLVGYASVAFRNNPHPTDSDDESARYLVIYVVGVVRELQGVQNPKAPGESYAATLFRTLERFARERDDVVGLSLWVRSDNDRAIHFYRKLGFIDDPSGPISRDAGAPHITMRKLFEEAED